MSQLTSTKGGEKTLVEMMRSVSCSKNTETCTAIIYKEDDPKRVGIVFAVSTYTSYVTSPSGESQMVVTGEAETLARSFQDKHKSVISEPALVHGLHAFSLQSARLTMEARNLREKVEYLTDKEIEARKKNFHVEDSRIETWSLLEVEVLKPKTIPADASK